MDNSAWAGSPEVQKVMTEQQFQRLVDNMNAVLASNSPRDENCEKLLIKVVSQIDQETGPDLSLVLHIHKYAGDLAGDAILEHVYFSVDMVHNKETGISAGASVLSPTGSAAPADSAADSNAGPKLAA
jgi:hypothetical protein